LHKAFICSHIHVGELVQRRSTMSLQSLARRMSQQPRIHRFTTNKTNITRLICYPPLSILYTTIKPVIFCEIQHINYGDRSGNKTVDGQHIVWACMLIKVILPSASMRYRYVSVRRNEQPNFGTRCRIARPWDLVLKEWYRPLSLPYDGCIAGLMNICQSHTKDTHLPPSGRAVNQHNRKRNTPLKA